MIDKDVEKMHVLGRVNARVLNFIGLGRLCAGIFGAIVLGIGTVNGSDSGYEHPPINYSETKPNTPLTRIGDRIKNGERLLRGETDQEILVQLLDLMEIPVESQIMVYSKTSAQNGGISPSTPRAIYFSDNAYLGWVRGGNIEALTFDKDLGAVFHMVYLTRRKEGQAPEIVREQGCLSCHAGSPTKGFPGVLARSVYPSRSGQPIFHAGTFRIDHSNPITERWGGWYVTGDTGGQPHLGNILAKDDGTREVTVSKIQEGPVTDLNDFLNCEPYPAGGQSDVVALMVFEHQLVVHNALVQGTHVTRQTLYRHEKMRAILNEPKSTPLSPTSERILEDQADHIVRALLFADEFLGESEGIEGAEAFQTAFAKDVPRTESGRSLKDFRLLKRIFKHRCSYMIYSDSFTQLPSELKERVLARIEAILTGKIDVPDYAYLSGVERKRILEILDETLPGWRGS